MSDLTANSSACPACVVAPAATEVAARVDAAAPAGAILLSLPTIHCSACISSVERTLNAMSGVNSARVNLTLKRASVEAEPSVGIDDLTTALENAGFEAHELDASAIAATETNKAGRDLLMRLAVAFFASMNVMLLSVAVWSGAEDATRDMFHWISAAIAFPAIGFSAQPFFKNAWAALSKKRMNMDVPIALAIALALGTSLYETAHSGEHAYFDAALTLTCFLLAGRYLDHRTRAVARSAAEELAALEVPRALRIVLGPNGEKIEETVLISDLAKGDLLLVKPGGRMPVDGEVVEGKSELDRSLLTGETLPVFVEQGQLVSAGEVNLTGPLVVRTTAFGRDTSLHRMADLVAIAESGRNRYTSLADKAAKLYAPGVHILAGLSFIGWYIFTQDMRTAINIAAAVLIITCPCALGLAVPAVTTAASGRLFKRGMLIKHETALERLAEVKSVVFDKTGTLTNGTPVFLDEGQNADDLAVAIGLAKASAHPLAQALVQSGKPAALIEEIKEVPGYGVEGQWNGQRVRLGRGAWVGATDESFEGPTTWLRIGENAPVRFGFRDTLRTGAREAVSELLARGVPVHLISGDTKPSVAALARELGISNWQAGVLPEEKAGYINDLSQSGPVLMVGDGLNDTAALAAAHVSISPASALDAARVASDIVLLGSDLSSLPEALTTAQKSTKRIRENFRIATLYNFIAVPIAVAGLATPLAAALAMSLSSITVSLNALRLR
ncbi:heavy metal translocating P-type ATPase [Halocynthiibacter sp. C4]|uniref:heavy metal translocating P-type ATPase n=1 Tax=Halocynthiibacter sp. C4 TaxID=2992758 RepID=UPI00237BE178|nr:heavy metal translocating P-type ATPase [Halocynthiibacter sp. C4]MDE0590686.1 heavy metal translocating P-type ATPase [Halocynthiibacter sp. C4]